MFFSLLMLSLLFYPSAYVFSDIGEEIDDENLFQLENEANDFSIEKEKEEVFHEMSEERVREIIKDYLKDNYAEIMMMMEEKQKLARAKEQSIKIESIVNKERLFLYESANDLVIGNPNGSKQAVEFFDYMCGYCKKAFDILQEVTKEDNDIGVHLKHLPILGNRSEDMARSAMEFCSMKPDDCMSIHNYFMSIARYVDDWNIYNKGFSSFLREKEIDPQTFINSLEKNKFILNERLKKNSEIAYELGVGGTPATLIKNKIHHGFITKINLIRALNDTLSSK